MTPQLFLDVADELTGGDNEGHWRSATSRAYYAAFHTAKVLLVRCGFEVPRSETAHIYLSRRLGNCGHPELGEVGHALGDLRTARNRADYDISREYPHSESNDRVAQAMDIIQMLSDLADNDEVRERVVEAMREYERDVLKEATWHDPNSSSAS